MYAVNKGVYKLKRKKINRVDCKKVDPVFFILKYQSGGFSVVKLDKISRQQKKDLQYFPQTLCFSGAGGET